ncbi:hypothetical protein BFV94_4196 [Alteromonas macleodii]|uniref:Uncharacterized protein n=1 Tax=Alteromonas macleodii TaxID=28108 RepID=A0AB36FM83_ALTMA|nr:hypothetical protein BFV95_4206 [Alteromonas macleodii]OES26681.1 hypothetical protein BFV94_4196 [Alteromonas macleodii]OES39384.1 hypothetical protein BFV96_4186 [Alteromonas macleodii]
MACQIDKSSIFKKIANLVYSVFAISGFGRAPMPLFYFASGLIDFIPI